MRQIVVEVPDEWALYWQALATHAELPLEGWVAWCCSFASILGLPISEVVLGQPSVEREVAGVAWEVRTRRSVEEALGGGTLDNTVPILDVRTGIKRKRGR